MSLSWDIVFWKDESCEYLPTTWAVNSEKNLYLWPRKISNAHLKRLLEECKPPSVEVSYDEFPGICKKTVYTLKEAQKYTKMALLTSNLESDDDSSVSEAPAVVTEVVTEDKGKINSLLL